MITLKTLAEATEQEVFNQIATGLMEQGKKSLVNGRCCYRSDDGSKCAAGMLIADDEYKPVFDKRGTRGESSDWEGIVLMGYATKAHKELIMQLQNIHDTFEPSEWKERLRDYARIWRLKIEVDCLK